MSLKEQLNQLSQKFQVGGEVPQEDWKQKYSTNPYFKDREDWGDKLGSKFPNAKNTVKDSIYAVAKQSGVDPAILYTSAMEEGMKLALNGKDTFERREGYNQFRKSNPKGAQEFPIDGGYFYGLNTFGDKYGKVIKPSSLPQGFKYAPYEQKDPQGNTLYTSAAFRSHDDAIAAKAAMMKQVEGAMTARLQKNNLNLSPEARKFFDMVGYNMGEDKTIDMIKSYEQKGYLKDDKFLDPNFQPASWKEPYTNVQRRYQNYKILNDQGYFKDYPSVPQGQQMAVSNHQVGGEIKNELEGTKEWWNRYINSPKYTERLQKEFPDYSPEQIQSELSARKQNLDMSYPVVGEGHFKGEMKDAMGFTAPPEIDERMYATMGTRFDNFMQDHVAPSSRPVFVKSGADSSTYNHELSHSVDEGGRRIPLKTVGELVNKVRGVEPVSVFRDEGQLYINRPTNENTLEALKNIDNFYPLISKLDTDYGSIYRDIKWKIGNDPKNYAPKFGYRGSPSEVLARLQPLREELYNKGVHDSATEDISYDTLKKYIEDTFNNTNEPIPDHLMDLLNEVKGGSKEATENLQWMLNNIASNKNTPNTQMAQKGGQINIKNQLSFLAEKYQLGGCTECEQKMQKGGNISEVWREKTGMDWSEAKSMNLTDGSKEQNLNLLNRLKNNEVFNTAPYSKEDYTKPPQTEGEQSLEEINLTLPLYDYQGCVNGLCHEIPKERGESYDDRRKLSNMYGNAWDFMNTAFGSKINTDQIKEGDIVTLNRNKFKSDDERGIPSQNQHIGEVIMKDGVPFIRHYVEGAVETTDEKGNKVKKGRYFTEPMDDIKNFTKYTVSQAFRPDYNRDLNISKSNFKYDSTYSPNSIEEGFLKAADDKENIQQKLSLTSDEADRLTKLAYGVIGAETKFGRSGRTLYRMATPDFMQKLVKMTADLKNGNDNYDENINNLSQGYSSTKESTLFNVGGTDERGKTLSLKEVNKKIKEGDYKGLERTGNYLDTAFKQLGITPDSLDDGENSGKAAIATLSWFLKRNPNATDEELLKMYTGKKNVSNYVKKVEKFTNNADANENNNYEPSIGEKAYGFLSNLVNKGNKTTKAVKSEMIGQLRDAPSILPTNMRALAGDVLGSTKSITESTLSNKEMSALQDVIRANILKNKNIIEYDDYKTSGNKNDDVNGNSISLGKIFDPKYSLKTTLGQASIKDLGNGTYEVSDTYDFNDQGKSFGIVDDLTKRGVSPYAVSRALGRNFGSRDGSGAKVKIKINLNEKYQNGGVIKNELDDLYKKFTNR